MDDQYSLTGASFVLIISFTFQYMFGVVFVFPQMKKIIQREFYDGTYGIGPALSAVVLVELPLLIFIPCGVATILYFMAGFTPCWITWLES